MIEVLCSVLARNPIVSRALAGEDDPGFNGAALALDVSGFGPPETFRSLAAELFRAIKGLPPASGIEEIFLPGERSAGIARDRMANGIPLVRGTVDRLAVLAAELGIAVPDALARDAGA